MTRYYRDAFGDLFTEVNRIQEEFQRLFTGPASFPGPAVNVWADANNFYAEADLPDLDLAKLDVSVTDGTQLTIKGERTAPQVDGAVWVRQERPAGTFERTFALPTLIDADKVEAKYEHGVLRLTLPKSEAAKPRKITVTA